MKTMGKISLVLFLTVCLCLLPNSFSTRRTASGKTVDDPMHLDNELYRNKVIVLMYHHLHPVAKSGSTILPELFEEHMYKLQENHFNIISLKQFEDFEHGGEVPPNAVLLTFDDGYLSFYKYAYPILKKFGYTATSFDISGVTDNPHLSHLKHLTWDMMREMQQNGMTFGSHTYNQHDYGIVDRHGKERPMLTSHLFIEELDRMETDEEYEKRVREDLLLSKKRLEEELGVKQHVLCFPYGAYNDKVIEIAKQVGFDTFITIKPGINLPGNSIIYRVNAGSPKISADDLIINIKKQLPEELELPKISMYINGVARDSKQMPLMEHNRVFVPFRNIFEGLGASVEWNSGTQSAVAMKGNKKLVLKNGCNQAVIDGQTLKMDGPVLDVNGFLMVPARFVSESLGAVVDWDQTQQKIMITTN